MYNNIVNADSILQFSVKIMSIVTGQFLVIFPLLAC